MIPHLAARLDDMAAQRDLSGVALLTRGGEVLFEGSYGLANRGDRVPVHPRTRFGLASFTKMFTAVAVTSLVRERRFAFDTAVVDLLPTDRRPARLRPDVTVHHLLCHTSGIADYAEEEDEAFDYAAIWHERPSYRMLRPADFLPLFGDLPPYRAPGERLQYSNAGYVLLGVVIEEVTGRAYPEVVTERMFGPAGMADSGFFRLDEAWPDIATGYLPPERPGDPWRSNIYSIPVVGGADGGAFATAADIDRFLRAYDAGRLVGPELRDVMLTPHARESGELAMGYGVWLRGDGPGRQFGHGGGDPGVEVIARRVPEADATAVVLCNVSGGLAGEVRDLLLAEVTG
jgi:CubicO group peptidase (beta-lactamase class C family)